tara:strand:+ start:2748 stop:3608 length:861 start_codon:yes stop_codon:yes gene_type:complete
MKSHISKSPIGSLISFIKPKSINIKAFLSLLSCLFLFNAAPHFEDTNSTENTTMYSDYGYLKLNISTSSLSHYTEFYFNSNASQGLDPGYDASVFGGSPPSFSVYSHLVQNSTGIAFAVQSLSNTDMNDVTIPIGINVSQGQEVFFSIGQNDIPESIQIYLEDTNNETSTLLTTNDYSFIVDENLSGIGRFYLRFVAESLSTAEESLEELSIYSNTVNKTITIKGQLISETNFRLYNINGRLVSTTFLDITSLNQSINTSNLSLGIYIIELTNRNSKKRTQKLVIH